MKTPPDPHYRHRFPAEIISHAVWLYHVFSLSLRDVELLVAERRVVVSYETVRRWCKKFAASLRRPDAASPPTARGQMAYGRCVTNTFPNRRCVRNTIYGHFRPRRHRLAASAYRVGPIRHPNAGLTKSWPLRASRTESKVRQHGEPL